MKTEDTKKRKTTDDNNEPNTEDDNLRNVRIELNNPPPQEQVEPNLTDPEYPLLDMPFVKSERANDIGYKMYEADGRKLVIDPENSARTYYDGVVFEQETQFLGNDEVPKQVPANMTPWAQRYQDDTYYYGRPSREVVETIIFLEVETLLTGLRKDIQSLAKKIGDARDKNRGLDTVETEGDEDNVMIRIVSVVNGIDNASVLPPIKVKEAGGGYEILDGNHRIVGSMFRKLARIPAIRTDN